MKQSANVQLSFSQICLLLQHLLLTKFDGVAFSLIEFNVSDQELRIQLSGAANSAFANHFFQFLITHELNWIYDHDTYIIYKTSVHIQSFSVPFALIDDPYFKSIPEYIEFFKVN
jgi:hypothetical protein